MPDLIGENLSYYSNLEFLVANGAQELLDQIRQIKLPCQIIAMYPVGSKHYAWIKPTGKLKKVQQKTLGTKGQ